LTNRAGRAKPDVVGSLGDGGLGRAAPGWRWRSGIALAIKNVIKTGNYGARETRSSDRSQERNRSQSVRAQPWGRGWDFSTKTRRASCRAARAAVRSFVRAITATVALSITSKAVKRPCEGKGDGGVYTPGGSGGERRMGRGPRALPHKIAEPGSGSRRAAARRRRGEIAANRGELI